MTDATKPQPIAAAAPDFQAKLEPLLKMVAHQGKEIIITRNGYPIARVTPYAPQPGDPEFPAAEQPVSVPYGKNRTRKELMTDIVGPMPMEWWFDQKAQWEDAP